MRFHFRSITFLVALCLGATALFGAGGTPQRLSTVANFQSVSGAESSIVNMPQYEERFSSTGGCQDGSCATNAFDSAGCSSGGCQDGSCSTQGYGSIGCGPNASMLFRNGGPSQFFLCGWIQQGITLVPEWPDSGLNTPMYYTQFANEYQMNQLYLSAGRRAATSGCRWDWGVRADLLYGTDYTMTSAIGLETERHDINGVPTNNQVLAESKWNDTGKRYGLSLPQAYAELFIPVHYGLNIKAGKFYSPMGYESVMAPANFFYSRSYSMMYCAPTTLTGGLISQKIAPTITAHFGLTQGWNAWESPSDTTSYLAGIQWNSWDQRTNLGFMVHTGKTWNSNSNYMDIYNNQGETNNRTNYSIVFSHCLTPSLKYVLEHNYGFENNGAHTGIDLNSGEYIFDNGEWASINQHLILQLTQSVSVGCRFEWMNDKNRSVITAPGLLMSNDFASEGTNYYNLTFGMNWKPSSFCTLRPEIRYDWTDVQLTGKKGTFVEGETVSIFNDGKDKSQLSLGLDLIFAF